MAYISFTDNFNRTDGGLGSNWATTSAGTLTIVSNQVGYGSGGSGRSLQYVTESVAVFDADQRAIATIHNPTTNAFASPAVRCQPDGSGYMLRTDGGDTSLRRIERMDAGAVPVTLGNVNIPVSDGDSLEIYAVGSTIFAKKNGTLVDSVTDTNYDTGQPGLYYHSDGSTTTKIDNFEAYDYRQDAKYNIKTKPNIWSISSTFTQREWDWFWRDSPIGIWPIQDRSYDKFRSLNGGNDLTIYNGGSRLGYPTSPYGIHAANSEGFGTPWSASNEATSNYGLEHTMVMLTYQRYNTLEAGVFSMRLYEHSSGGNDGYRVEFADRDSDPPSNTIAGKIRFTLGGIADYDMDIPAGNGQLVGAWYLINVVCSGNNGTVKVALKDIYNNTPWEVKTTSIGTMTGTPNSITLWSNRAFGGPNYNDLSYMAWWPKVISGFSVNAVVDPPMLQLEKDVFGPFTRNSRIIGSAPRTVYAGSGRPGV